MRRSLLAGACALAILAGCTGQTVTVDLAHEQAQANAAVADVQALGLNLIAQNVLPVDAFANVMQGVNAANVAFQSIKSGTQTAPQLASNVAAALQKAVAVMGPKVPTQDAAILNAAVAAVNAYAASISAAPAA